MHPAIERITRMSGRALVVGVVGALALSTSAALAQSPAPVASGGPMSSPGAMPSYLPCPSAAPGGSATPGGSVAPGGSGAPATTPCGTQVTVEATEFSLTPSAVDLPAGTTTFNVVGTGVIAHEFVVFQTDLPADQLPMDADESEVDEEGAGLTSMGEVEDVDPGVTRRLTLTLPAGNYVAICNIEGHYAAGMRYSFTVH